MENSTENTIGDQFHQNTVLCIKGVLGKGAMAAKSCSAALSEAISAGLLTIRVTEAGNRVKHCG